MSIPIILITTPTDSSFTTTAYDVTKLDSDLLKRIYASTSKQSWDEVWFGDVKENTKECRYRTETVSNARLLFDPSLDVPKEYRVQAIFVYPKVSEENLPKVIMATISYGNNPPCRELWLLDQLPPAILKRIEEMNTETDVLKVLYGGMVREYLVDSDFAPGNEAIKAEKEARIAHYLMTEKAIEDSVVKGRIDWVKGQPKGYNVVMERFYHCS